MSPDTERRLSAAALVTDADLPELPPSFLHEVRRAAQNRSIAEPASVVAARQLADEARRHRGSSGRPAARRFTVGLAAAATITGVLVLDPGTSTPSAVADYDYAPTASTPAERAERVAACADALAGSWSASSEWAAAHPFRRADQQAVVVDTRGPWSLTVLVDGATVADCLQDDGAVVGLARQELSPAAVEPISAGARTVGLRSTSMSDGQDLYGSTAYGRTASDVRTVEVLLPDGEIVTATVEGGWWAAWWPGITGDDRGVQLRVTDLAGRSTTSALADTY